MFKSPSDIIETLENAIVLYRNTNRESNRDEAKLTVVACKVAIQTHCLELSQKMFDRQTGVIDATPRISKIHDNEKTTSKRLPNKNGKH